MAKGESVASVPAIVGNAVQLRTLLESKRESIAEVASSALKPDRLLKMALVAASKTPKLYKCTQISVIRALMDAAELGLDVSGQLGSAYLIPFENKRAETIEAVFMIGYRGLIDLARRSGEVSKIEAVAVYANDQFEVEYGLNPDIRHRRPKLGEARGALVGVYAVATLKDGAQQFDVMDKAEIEIIRNLSKAGNSGPWKDFYGEMARKTVVRRLVKYLPISVEAQARIAEAVEKEDEVFGLGDAIGASAPPEEGTMAFGKKAKDKAEVDAIEIEGEDVTDKDSESDAEGSESAPEASAGTGGGKGAEGTSEAISGGDEENEDAEPGLLEDAL